MTSSASKENAELVFFKTPSQLASPQSTIIDKVNVGRYRGREVRDILSNDRQLPDEIRKELTVDSRFGIDWRDLHSLVYTKDTIYHRGVKYQLCWGNKLNTIRQSGYALLHFRYWPRLPIGFVYITQLTAEGFKVYREYDPKLANQRSR